MKTTASERAAHRAGYPPVLLGFTPNDKYYWSEPGLPWSSTYLNEHPGPTPATWQKVHLDTDVMAPRFPKGCSVVVEAVHQGQPLLPGVYVWHTPHAPGQHYIGRLVQAPTPTQNFLSLWQDKSQQEIICLLDWGHPAFALSRVTYYNSMPGA